MTFDPQTDFSTRLEFLYRAVEDTQQTIRFIDTKAAFCVTLLSGMVAGALQGSPLAHHGRVLHNVCLFLFLCAVGLSLLVCLRVIFPVIKPHSATPLPSGRVAPKFFVHQAKGHHWLRHTFSNSVDDVLAEDHDSYTTTMATATSADLAVAMCDELLMVSLIRQIKSDRLHTAMYSLILAIGSFFSVMVT